MTRTIILLLATAALAGCAGTGPNPQQMELNALTAQCSARGGTLVNARRTPTGRVGADNACVLPSGGRLGG